MFGQESRVRADEKASNLGVRPLRSLPAVLAYNGERFAASPALRFTRRGLCETWTWHDLQERVHALASGLEGEGFSPGSVLVTLCELCPEWLAVVLAAHSLGGTVLPIAPSVDDDELRAQLERTRARFVVAQGASEVARVVSQRRLLADGPRLYVVESRGLERLSAPAFARLCALAQLDQTQRDVAGRADVGAQLAPAFIAFVGRSEGALERQAYNHGSLLAEACDALSLDPSDEIQLDSTREFNGSLLLRIAAWLASGARLGLG